MCKAHRLPCIILVIDKSPGNTAGQRYSPNLLCETKSIMPGEVKKKVCQQDATGEVV